MARLFVASLLFGLGAICIFAHAEELQAVELEYLKMLKCPGGKEPKVGPDGHALQCIPGGAGPPICGGDHSCWYNGFNYLCCPMEVKPILETDWPAKPRKPVKYDEVPVEELDVPVEALASGQAEQLGSAEIVRLTKTKSATLTPKTRNFPTVKSSVEEQSTSPAPESEVAEQRRAPSISERIVSAGALESEPIDVVDPNLEGQAEEAIPQKWQNVCPPASKPILVGKEKQLSSCLPRRNTCPVGSFCWFSTEEDYICCTEPRQPNVELPPSEPSLLPSSELSAGSAELPPTDDSEQPLVYGAETISAVQNITEYDISSQ
uniref:Uncharacterized protein n=1 Tax=Plectus sambesii TaxID=2011161 RepID=A0A914UQQ2_9BILA